MYVGNLPFSSTEDCLRTLFTAYGEVTDIFLPTDRDSGRLRGFAFVTMSTPEQMQSAIAALDSQDWNGRPLTVNEAQPKAPNAYKAAPSGPKSYNRQGDRGNYNSRGSRW